MWLTLLTLFLDGFVSNLSRIARLLTVMLIQILFHDRIPMTMMRLRNLFSSLKLCCPESHTLARDFGGRSLLSKSCSKYKFVCVIISLKKSKGFLSLISWVIRGFAEDIESLPRLEILCAVSQSSISFFHLHFTFILILLLIHFCFSIMIPICILHYSLLFICMGQRWCWGLVSVELEWKKVAITASFKSWRSRSTFKRMAFPLYFCT